MTAATCFGALLFWRVAFTDKLLLRRDMARVVLPLKAFWAERLRAGVLPEWFPHDALGQPLAGMMVSGAFHPANLLFLVLPGAVALTWAALLCFPVLAGGLWLLFRRLGASAPAAGLGVMLGTFHGYAVSITNSLPYLQAMAAVPWALWATLRFLEAPGVERAVLGGLMLALVLFAGDPQSFLVCCTLSLLLAVCWPAGRGGVRRVLAGGALMLAAALVAAPQLLAGAQVMGQALASRRPVSESLLWSMHPLRLVELVVGPLFGTGHLWIDPRVTESLLGSGVPGLWVESVSFGAVGTLFAAAGIAALRGRRRWLAVSALLAGLLLVLGRHGGLYRLLHRLVPVWRPFRYPEKLLPFLLLLLTAAAVVAAERAVADARFRGQLGRATAGGAAFLLLLAGAELALHPFVRLCDALAHRMLPAVIEDQLGANLVHGCLLGAGALAGVSVLLRRWRGAPTAWGVVGVAALLALLQGQGLYAAVSPEAIDTVPLTLQALRALPDPPRPGGPRVYSLVQSHQLPELPGVDFDDLFLTSMATGLEPDLPAVHGLEGANVYLPAASARVEALRRSGHYADRYAGLFAARYVAVEESDFRARGGSPESVVARAPLLHRLVVTNPAARPRVAFRRWRCVASLEEAQAVLAASTFDLDGTAVLECPGGASGESSSGPASGEVRLVSVEPERVEIAVEARTPGALVLADAFYSGWSASVDGAPVPILPANVAVRAVRLAPGAHRVAFVFRTPGLRAGLVLSAATLLLGAAFGLAGALGRVRARRRSPG
jgi:hypothetical protein